MDSDQKTKQKKILLRMQYDRFLLRLSLARMDMEVASSSNFSSSLVFRG